MMFSRAWMRLSRSAIREWGARVMCRCARLEFRIGVDWTSWAGTYFIEFIGRTLHFVTVTKADRRRHSERSDIEEGEKRCSRSIVSLIKRMLRINWNWSEQTRVSGKEGDREFSLFFSLHWVGASLERQTVRARQVFRKRRRRRRRRSRIWTFSLFSFSNGWRSSRSSSSSRKNETGNQSRKKKRRAQSERRNDPITCCTPWKNLMYP